MSYNGWTNYPTWNVNLWLDNDQGLQDEIKRLVRYSTDVYALSENIKAFVRDGDLLPDLGASFASDLLSYALDSVDWREIAQSWWDEYHEEDTDEEPEDDEE